MVEIKKIVKKKIRNMFILGIEGEGPLRESRVASLTEVLSELRREREPEVLNGPVEIREPHK